MAEQAPDAEHRLVIASPIDRLEIVQRGRWITEIRLDAQVRAGDVDRTGSPLLTKARTQLAEYFAGRRRRFDLPLRPAGTAFQRRVWDALLEIPWGETTTYGAIATRLGLPVGAARAVGAANGANPIPVVIPCHRVIGADGTLTGYAGGLRRKATLLTLEGAAAEQPQEVLF